MVLLYDGQCPFCSRYISYVGSRLKVKLSMVDVRQCPAAAADLRGQGYDVNDGVVLMDGAHVMQGREAVAALTAMTKPTGFLDRVVRRLTLIPGFLRVFYPGMRLARKMVLRMLGRDPRVSGTSVFPKTLRIPLCPPFDGKGRDLCPCAWGVNGV